MIFIFCCCKVCSGTNSGFSSSRKIYQRLKAIYTNCVYVDGNIEINNFNSFNEKNIDTAGLDPASGEDISSGSGAAAYDYDSLDSEFDFSFFDNIREITGYLLVHNSKIKNLRFKNLEIVRGKNKIRDKFSIYIDSNSRLERLDLTKLRGKQKLFHDSILPRQL